MCLPWQLTYLPICENIFFLLKLNESCVLIELNPRPDGPLDFPPPAGGGGGLNTHPSISAPAHRRTKQKTAFESSRRIISKSFRSFFGSGQN